MDDFFKRHKKRKMMEHSIIALSAFVFALWIHALLMTNNIQTWLQASLLWTDMQSTQKEADLSLAYENSSIKLFTQKNIDDLSSLSFSILMNPESWSLDLENIQSPYMDLQIENNTPGVYFINIFLDTDQSLVAGTEILTFPYTQLNDEAQYFNLIEANFTDSSGEKYLLSTTWTTN